MRAAAAGGSGQLSPSLGRPSKSRIELLYSVGVSAMSGALLAGITLVGEGAGSLDLQEVNRINMLDSAMFTGNWCRAAFFI